jgi:hypothetical protein
MLQTTKLLLLLGLALTCSVAAGNGRAMTATHVTSPQAVLHEHLTGTVVVYAVRISAWAVSTTVAQFGAGAADGTSAEPAARTRPEPTARPLMPFYSFASVLPRARGG